MIGLKNYTFQVHITESSTVKDHCISYALSDPKEKSLQQKCDHLHDHVCSSCEELKSVISSIEDAIKEVADKLPEDDRDDLRFTFQQATKAINDWKAHQLRSIQQDKSRIDTLKELAEDEVFITQDWAMKFLPQKYRESQTDWFGKRGISWHISVVVRKSKEGMFQHQTFVHIVKNCRSQDSDIVVPIMEHTLRQLKTDFPGINKASYRQDNAGCYHSVMMVTSCHLLEKATGIKIKYINFSDPQGGKGACDRKAATIKAHVRRYLNEGHDVVTAEDFRNAIISNGGVQGVRVAVVNGENTATPSQGKWKGISKFNNFSLTSQKATVWRAYKVGKGKSFQWSELEGNF